MRRAMPPRILPVSLLDRLAATISGDDSELAPGWREDAARRGMLLYNDRRLHAAARSLATSHERAIDYLSQAPALVLAVAGRASLSRAAGRRRTAEQFRSVIADGPRLKEVMRLYGVPFPLREVSGHALRLEHCRLLPALALVHPSSLAQNNPKTIQDQACWLNMLCQWQTSLATTSGDSEALLAWAATNLGNGQSAAAPMIIDFVAQNAEAFNTAWNRTTAIAAAFRWHASRIARPRAEPRPAVDLNAVADYGTLPLAFVLDGYEFVALDTAEKLNAEADAMKHCVRQYAPLVLTGACWIYSMRSAGRSIATFELKLAARLRSGHRHYALTQAKGYENARPLPQVRHSIDRFVAHVNTAEKPSRPTIGVL